MHDQIVFFDGSCGLCHSFVLFLSKRDKRGVFRYAPLQGETAKLSIPASLLTSYDTAYFLSNGHLYDRSSAAIHIISKLGGLWSIMKVFLIIPKFLRDPVYAMLARNRHRFSESISCQLPSPSLKELFLK